MEVHGRSFRLLYICGGNILRSPAAHLITAELGMKSQRLAKQVTVESAGLDDRSVYLNEWQGMQSALQSLGYHPPEKWQPRLLTPDILRVSSVAVCVEQRYADYCKYRQL